MRPRSSSAGSCSSGIADEERIMTIQDIATNTTDIDSFTQDWQAWRSRQHAKLADPHGFLAITNLHCGRDSS